MINALELIASGNWSRDPLAASLILSATQAQRDRIGFRYRLAQTLVTPGSAPPASAPPDLTHAIHAARNLALGTPRTVVSSTSQLGDARV